MEPNYIVKFIKDLGFPIAIAVILISVGMGWLPSPVLRNIEEQTRALKRHTSKEAKWDILLWQICRNTAAGSGNNPDNCVQPWKDND